VIAPSFQKLSHKTFGGLGIAAAQHQRVENETILIDTPPQPVLLAADGGDEVMSCLDGARLAI